MARMYTPYAVKYNERFHYGCRIYVREIVLPSTNVGNIVFDCVIVP
jgi:hypothetical protein